MPDPNLRTSTPDSWAVTLDYILGKKRAEEALGFLVACGGALNAAPGHAEAVRAVLELTVPHLADWARASFAPGAGIEPSAVRGSLRLPDTVDGPATQLSAALEDAAGAQPAAGFALAVPDGVLATIAGPVESRTERSAPDLARLAAAAGVESALVLPVAAAGRSRGVLTLLRTANHSDGAFAPGPTELAVDLARRLAWATEAFLARAAEAASAARE
jgi:hypothetical protein